MNHNQKVGGFGEKTAKEYLVKEGYQVIATNIKTSYKEIDIIALKDEKLVFVEVKTRTSQKYGSASEAVMPGKLKNLKNAIGAYLSDFNKKVKYKDLGLDLIAIDIDRARGSVEIEHYKDIA